MTFLNLALVIFQRNEASGYFIDNQNICASINAFKNIEKKHGQFILRNVKSLEHVKKKYSKVNQDINFIKACRRENLTPAFTKVKMAIKIINSKLK